MKTEIIYKRENKNIGNLLFNSSLGSLICFFLLAIPILILEILNKELSVLLLFHIQVSISILFFVYLILRSFSFTVYSDRILFYRTLTNKSLDFVLFSDLIEVRI